MAILGLLLSSVALGRIEMTKPPIKHQPVKVVDVQQAVKVIGTHVVCRAIQTTREDYIEIMAGYFRQVGTVFCEMQTSGDFSYSAAVTAVEKIPSPLLPDTYALDAKAALLAFYKLAYGDRLRAEIPPDRWLSEISQVFCQAISEGLKDAGKSGVN